MDVTKEYMVSTVIKVLLHIINVFLGKNHIVLFKKKLKCKFKKHVSYVSWFYHMI